MDGVVTCDIYSVKQCVLELYIVLICKKLKVEWEHLYKHHT